MLFFRIADLVPPCESQIFVDAHVKKKNHFGTMGVFLTNIFPI